MVVLMTGVLFFCHAPPTDSKTQSAYLPPNLYLVRATTVKVWRDEGEMHDTGQLRITRVIAGPKRLLNQEFLCKAGYRKFPGAQDFGLLDGIVGYLEKDAEGLWWVYEDPSYLTLCPELRHAVTDAYRLNAFPYQKTKKSDMVWEEMTSPRFAGIKPEKMEEAWTSLRKKEEPIWVDAVASVYSAKSDDDRRVLLERYAADPGSPVSGWAITLLARGPRESAVKFLRGLAGNDRIDPDAQVTLDRVLCKLDGKDWAKSSARLDMLRRWMDVKSSRYLFTLACHRLREAVSVGDLNAEMFAAVLKPAIARYDCLTEAQMRSMCLLLGSVRFAKADRDKGFKFLDDLADNCKSENLKSSAIEGLQQFKK